MNRQLGFSLIELMITVAVVGILAAIAAPNFATLIEDQRVASQANDLVSSIQVARSEAVKRGKNITFSPISGGYASGWCIFEGAACTGTNILRQHEAAEKITGEPSAALVFDALGGANSTAASPLVFTLTPNTCATGQKRQRTLTVGPTGRVSMQIVPCT